ncbi:MAG: type IV conjugative transfer system protein TraL [Rickettsiales bacterium]|jgi:conjugal transfer pilus assembly protein TraL|nr:type IV conjugative transfer system protein TraL [Rickettsiales bacterium]
MRDLSNFIVPKTLDEPEKILFFTYVELAVLMFPLIVGITIGHTIKGVIGGVLFFFCYKKVNPSNDGFSITHLAYWYLPSWLFNLKKIPSSDIRIYIGN